jgi:hypothetical protein
LRVGAEGEDASELESGRAYRESRRRRVPLGTGREELLGRERRLIGEWRRLIGAGSEVAGWKTGAPGARGDTGSRVAGKQL